MDLKELLGKPLTDFFIDERFHVFKVDDDGSFESSLGVIQSELVAQAFAENQTDAAWHRVEKVLVLTNGKIGFLFNEPIKILKDSEAASEVRQKVLSKLSEAERKLLGLEEL